LLNKAFLLQLNAIFGSASLYPNLEIAMASISRRGSYQYQAIIRRKGYPVQTKTFESRAEAEEWVRDVESKMDRGYFRDRREIENTTLAQALERYVMTVTPTKRGCVTERNRLRKIQKHFLSQRTLSQLRACDFAQYRDEQS
jgi:hypothetical protein